MTRTKEKLGRVMAALSLNLHQLAEVLGVPSATLYDGLEGNEATIFKNQRWIELVELLEEAGVTSTHSIRPGLVRASLKEGELSLIELLKAPGLDKTRILEVLQQAKKLEEEAEEVRTAREEKLRKLGFEEPSNQQRKENLAKNIALREWPKDLPLC